jgi:hypothetical protein
MRDSPLMFWAAVAIALATLLSGAAQMTCPSLVLRLVGGETGPSQGHFFGIIGMFMVLFGGLLFQGLSQGAPIALFWAGLQKFGAAAAVGLGAANHLFSPLAWAVAGFDLLSGLIIARLWWLALSGPGELR